MIISNTSILKLFLLLFFTVIVLSGCESKKPVKIGFITSLTGRMADMGIPARNAVQLAVEQCNKEGGIHGRKISLIIRDDQQDDDTAVQAVQELIKEEVTAVIGPTVSNMAIPIVPYLNNAKVVAISPTVTTPNLSGLDDYFFRVCTTAGDFAGFSANYLISSGDMRQIAVAHEISNRPFSDSWIKSFNKTFTDMGGKILSAIEFSTENECSFSDISSRLLASNPDGIIIVAAPMDSALLCQHIRKNNPSVKIALSSWGGNQRFIELGGKATEGVTVASSFDWASPNPRYQAFKKIYNERYRSDPGLFGLFSYNSAQVLLTALKAQKHGQNIKDTILSIGEFDVLQGKIRFDAFGDVESSFVTMQIVKNRKYVVIE